MSDRRKMTEVKIGIVGSRKRDPLNKIRQLLQQAIALNPNKQIIVVSGGAHGTDKCAETIANELGLKTQIFHPNYAKGGTRIFFERNKLIAENSDILIAFPLNMEGGTMNTVNWWNKLNKPKENLLIYNKTARGRTRMNEKEITEENFLQEFIKTLKLLNKKCSPYKNEEAEEG